jgi:hypothetical protein
LALTDAQRILAFVSALVIPLLLSERQAQNAYRDACIPMDGGATFAEPSSCDTIPWRG